jgi:hypothetical protein
MMKPQGRSSEARPQTIDELEHAAVFLQLGRKALFRREQERKPHNDENHARTRNSWYGHDRAENDEKSALDSPAQPFAATSVLGV